MTAMTAMSHITIHSTILVLFPLTFYYIKWGLNFQSCSYAGPFFRPVGRNGWGNQFIYFW